MQEIPTQPQPLQSQTIVSPPDEDDSGGMEVNRRTEGSTEQAWNKVIRWLIYAMAFLLPLLFTPWTNETLEFSKQMLLFVLGSAGLIAWLLKLLVLRTWKLVKTPLDFPIGIFLLVYLLASVFSVDRTVSFLGFYGSFAGNFFQVLFLILLFYLVVNHFETKEQLKRLMSVFFTSLLIAFVYTILQFFGWFVLPIAMTKNTGFNTLGGLLTLSVFATMFIVYSIGQKAQGWFGWSGNLWKIIGIIAAVMVLVTVNFNYSWIALLIGLFAYIIFRISSSSSGFSMKNIVAPLAMVIVTVAFLVMNSMFSFLSPGNLFKFELPTEVRLDYQTARPVLTQVIKEKPVFGSGPGTFLYAFSEYRDQSFNLSPFWNVRFDRAPSEAAEYLTSSGLLGFLAFEILSLIFLIYGFYFLMKNRGREFSDMAITAYASFGVLWFAHWFFPFNTPLLFSYWFLLAGFVAISRAAGGERIKTTSFSLATSPRQTVGVVSVVSLLLVLVVVFLFFTSSVYAADIFYAKALKLSNDKASYDKAQIDFERAIQLDRYRPDYYLTYGEFLFLRINQELTKSAPDTGLIQQWLATGINISREAVDLSPANWTAWERLANLYVSARPLVAGVDKFIIDSLQRATDTDSKNPILYVELGQVYRLAAQQIDPAIVGDGKDSDGDGLSDQQEAAIGSDPEDPDTNANGVLDGTEVLSGLDPSGSGQLPADFLSQYLRLDKDNLLKAEDAFHKAIELKSDYLTAYYQLALTLEQLGKNDEAQTVLEDTLKQFPNNVDVKFELGRLYFNTGNLNQAARQFQEILTVVPNHSNARFSLASVFERQGDLRRALIEYRKVADLNPDVQVLNDKIQQLEQEIQKQNNSE